MAGGNDRDHYKYLCRPSVVHVDDVASAHIFLFESPNAKGRYICSSNNISLENLATIISTKYPNIAIPTVDSLKDIEGYAGKGILSSQKLLDSGFKYKYGPDEIFDGAIKS